MRDNGDRNTEADLHLYRVQAEIAKVLANPVRLRILSLIGEEEAPAGDLLKALGSRWRTSRSTSGRSGARASSPSTARACARTTG